MNYWKLDLARDLGASTTVLSFSKGLPVLLVALEYSLVML
ncbi:hypothetical protein ACU8KH_01450 [Lachancea thermotolerans]